ncbi:Ankyrin repeat domain-containing protein EMB506, chloroplastic [Apostasia shenzhenica]|uniref:Ankyrin repeat domain-containing protein EMB506, chloroplastic n=1 Tax=Apostasia shenzhenica TaxID=1088818 RepID=A0A2I0A8S6_9ASPA|nr:Ankyrin repeat domain-containing protein EMB506, chloroplastic [Apostasia shenzhenica]
MGKPETLFHEDELHKLNSKETAPTSGLETRLTEMVWLDDSSGFSSLMKLNFDNEGLDASTSTRLLQLACKLDSVRCAKVLIEGQTGPFVCINEMDGLGRSPLHNAAEMLSTKCIDLLLQKHARTDLRSKDGDALLALEIALASKRKDINWSLNESVEQLLASLLEMDLSAIKSLALETRELTEVSYMMAMEGRVVELATLLLVGRDKVTAPASATVHVKGILSPKKSLNMYDLVLEESLELFGMIKSRKPGASFKSVCMLYWKRKALLSQIELLHLFGVPSMISSTEKKVLPPLIRATQAGDLPLVEVLIKVNVDVNEIDGDGNSSLHWCLKGNSRFQNLRILCCLLKHGIKAHLQNNFGLTPVHLASARGNCKALQILLLHDPDCVDIPSLNKETPLFLAVKANAADCVKLLLQLGANQDALNLRRQRPIDLAQSDDMRILLTGYTATFSRNNLMMEDNPIHTLEEENFPGLKAGIAKLYNIPECKKMDSKMGICRFFHSPTGCGRGNKCYYLHGEEVQRLDKSCFWDLTRLDKDDLHRKIFVGGLHHSVDSDYLKKIFEEKFGPVEDAVVIGTQTGIHMLSRGFGFLTFKQEDSRAMALNAHFITISGKRVEIKSAMPSKKLVQENPNRTTSSNFPPWVLKFMRWFPSYLNKVSRRLGEGEWYPLSSLKGDFRATCGMELDYESLGFSKLSDFLRSFPGICSMHVVPTSNGAATHMVLLPFHSRPFFNRINPQQFKLESELHVDEEAPNPLKWERMSDLLHCNPRRRGDGFLEYTLQKTVAAISEQPGLVAEKATWDEAQQPFSYFAHQWDNGLLVQGYCIICKSSSCAFVIYPCFHNVCHSCVEDLSGSCACRSPIDGIQLLESVEYVDDFPPLGPICNPHT